MGVYVGNTSSLLVNLDMWGFLLLVPAGLAALAAWEEAQEDGAEEE